MPSGTKASRISKTFDELTNKISAFTKQISSAETIARKFDGALKLDPNNVSVAKEKFDNLSNALKLAQERLDANKRQLEELNTAWSDKKGTDEYKAKLNDITRDTKKYSAEVERLTVLVKNAKTEVANANPALNTFKGKLKEMAKNTDLWGKALKTAKVLLVSMIAAVVKLTKEMSNLGKELVSNADKYGTTVEMLQKQSYLFYTLTGNADAYTSSLQAMNSVMAQILSGRGQSQLKSLAQIGLKKSDIEGLTTAEAYEVVFNALRDVEDQATATAVAVKLFGDAGAYVAEMANKSDEEFNKYIEKFRQAGAISTESAKKLAELSDDLYLFRYQLKVTGAELLSNLAPAINAVTSVLLTLTKGVSGVYEAFGSVIGSILLFASVLTIKMIPSIIKLIVQTKLATSATLGHVIAQTALISVLSLGILTITAVGAAVGASSLASKKAAEEMNSYTDSVRGATEAAKEYERVTSKLKSDLSVSTESIEKTNNTYSSNVTFTIKAEGDTPISDETAKKVGEITVDQVNKALGGIIA